MKTDLKRIARNVSPLLTVRHDMKAGRYVIALPTAANPLTGHYTSYALLSVDDGSDLDRVAADLRRVWGVVAFIIGDAEALRLDAPPDAGRSGYAGRLAERLTRWHDNAEALADIRQRSHISWLTFAEALSGQPVSRDETRRLSAALDAVTGMASDTNRDGDNAPPDDDDALERDDGDLALTAVTGMASDGGDVARCAHCGAILPPGNGRRFCSKTCRQKAYRRRQQGLDESDALLTAERLSAKNSAAAAVRSQRWQAEQHTVQCQHCGKLFKVAGAVNAKRAKYCSGKCRVAAWRKRAD